MCYNFNVEDLENKKYFPNGFVWGSATASYQVEGGIENNDWAQAARDGRVPAAGRACDHYIRYEEDFDIAKSLSQNAHRFSIEWARVEPEEGKFDEVAIEHYRKVLQALRDRGLEPFVTLYHWTLPLWFVKKGSWLARDSHEIFGRYCGHVVEGLGDSAKFWITINEPLVFSSHGYLKGNWPPFKKNLISWLRVVSKLIMSHNVAYKKIKAVNPNLNIGVAKHNINFESNKNPLNWLLSRFMIWFWNHHFLKSIKQDFIGLNYYFHRKFGDKEKYEKNDMGWDIYPKGIYNVLIELKKYSKPIYITENGLADAVDTKRAKFIKEHLQWVLRAIHPVRSLAHASGVSPKDLGEATSNGVNDGVDVRGYFYWSLLDNFEWAHGFDPRFGLVEMNYDTLERKIRPSAYEYKKICESNSI